MEAGMEWDGKGERGMEAEVEMTWSEKRDGEE